MERLPRSWDRFLVAIAPIVFTLPRFWNQFVFDDVHMIVSGDFIHDPSNLPRAFSSHAMIASSLNSAVGTVPIDTYRPISIATFFFDAALSGREPWAYHLTNTALHAMNCVLLLALVRRFAEATTPRGVHVLLVLCFGLSPWLSEAHVFINGRSDLLLAMGVLTAFLIQDAFLAKGGVLRLLGLGAATLFALASKETAVVVLPFIVLLPTRGAFALRHRLLGALPVGLALIAYVAARYLALEGFRTHRNGAHLFAVLQNLPLLWYDGLVHLLVPTPYALRNLRDDYASLGLVVRTMAAVSFFFTLAVLAWAALQRRALVFVWGTLLILCTLSPAVMITTELWQGFGRYLYVPAIGLCVATGWLLPWLAARAPLRVRPLVTYVPCIFCVVSALLLWDATVGFRDELRLYGRAMARAPDQAWTVGSLGLAEKRVGHCQRAVPLLARADAMAPMEPRYAVHLARCLITLQDLEGARTVALRGQERHRGSRAEAGFLVAEFLTLPRDRPDLAEPLLRRCLLLQPSRPDCQAGLTMVLADRTRRQTSP